MSKARSSTLSPPPVAGSSAEIAALQNDIRLQRPIPGSKDTDVRLVSIRSPAGANAAQSL